MAASSNPGVAEGRRRAWPSRICCSASAWICTVGARGPTAVGRSAPASGLLVPITTAAPARRSNAAVPSRISIAEIVRAGQYAGSDQRSRKVPPSCNGKTRAPNLTLACWPSTLRMLSPAAIRAASKVRPGANVPAAETIKGTRRILPSSSPNSDKMPRPSAASASGW